MSNARQIQLQKEQDEQLEEIERNAQNLLYASQNIGVQISTQGEMLKNEERDMEKTEKKLNFVMKKLSKLLQTSDTGALCSVMLLSLILVVLVFMVFL